MSKYDIYGLGAALVDTEVEVEDEFLENMGIEKGLMTLVDEDRQHELMAGLEDHLVGSKRASGGSAANTIIASSYFGSKTFYSCKVANDDNGHFYLNDLKEAGVDSNFHSEKETGITGKCLVMITDDAERTMNTYLGISASLCEKELNEDAISQSRWLYVEGYLVTSNTGRAAAVKARKLAEQHGVKTAFSLSDPGMVEFFKPGLEEMLGDGVDLLFCNKEEALHWANSDILDNAIEALKSVAKQFAITLGAEGALVYDGQALHKVEGTETKAIDTNGAGDMFAGAFLHGICQGMGFDEAGRLASKAAAKVVSQYGPRLQASQHQEVLEQL